MGEHWDNATRRARHFMRSLFLAFTAGCVLTALVLVTSDSTRAGLVVLAVPPVVLATLLYLRARRRAAAADG